MTQTTLNPYCGAPNQQREAHWLPGLCVAHAPRESAWRSLAFGSNFCFTIAVAGRLSLSRFPNAEDLSFMRNRSLHIRAVWPSAPPSYKGLHCCWSGLGLRDVPDPLRSSIFKSGPNTQLFLKKSQLCEMLLVDRERLTRCALEFDVHIPIVLFEEIASR